MAFMIVVGTIITSIVYWLVIIPMPHSSYYLIQRIDDYQFPMMIKEYEVKFYVKSYDIFDEKSHTGKPERADIENTIIIDYIHMVKE